MRHLFILGNNIWLSYAELFAIFGKQCEMSMVFPYGILTQGLDEAAIIQRFPTIGGVIKVIRVDEEHEKDAYFSKYASTHIPPPTQTSKKLCFAIASYGKESPTPLQDGIRLKKILSQNHPQRSFRIVNKENTNINASVYKKEQLGTSGIEWNVCWNETRKTYYFGQTIVFQDVDEYSNRDIARMRDMDVGMLPPKLAQICINIAFGEDTNGTLYDPFCGLGTVLIEGSLHAGLRLVGSDISHQMVDATRTNLSGSIQDPDRLVVFQADVRTIGNLDTHTYPELLHGNCRIVSEGFLGEIVSSKNIKTFRAEEECIKLTPLYRDMFAGLKQIGFTGEIVIALPFWRFGKTEYFMEDIYTYIRKLGFIPADLLPCSSTQITRRNSLLYIRPGQHVGREIYHLRVA